MLSNDLAEIKRTLEHTLEMTHSIEKSLSKIEVDAAEVKGMLIDIYKVVEKSYKGDDEIIENARRVFSRYIVDEFTGMPL